MLYYIYHEAKWQQLCEAVGETIPRGGYTQTYNGDGFVTLDHPDVFWRLNVHESDIVAEDPHRRGTIEAQAKGTA